MEVYITVEPNVKIYVEDLNPGRKKTILFIHGCPVNHKLFEYQFDQLTIALKCCMDLEICFISVLNRTFLRLVLPTGTSGSRLVHSEACHFA
jgi:hypothetical protein